MIEAARAGETHAFADLVKSHYFTLYKRCLQYTRDADAAADIVQDSIVSAYLKLGDLKDPSSFEAWLTAIAVNHCHRWRRHQQRYRPLDDEDEFLVDPRRSPEEVSLSTETRVLVEEGIERLNPLHQQVVRMFYLEDRSLRQIARALGLTVQAANQRLYRARLSLKEGLGVIMRNQSRSMAIREWGAVQDALGDYPTEGVMDKEEIRGLERRHDEMCVLLNSTLNRFTPDRVEADVAFVDQVNVDWYVEYLKRRTSVGPLYTFSLPPFEGRAALEIRGTLWESLDTGVSNAKNGKDTPAVVNAILQDLETALSPIREVSVTDVLPESNATDLHVADADDVLEVVAVQVSRPEWWFTLVYPASMFDEMARSDLIASPWQPSA